MLGGDFSLGGVGKPIYDPATTRQLANGNWVRDPFPGNIFPGSLRSSGSKASCSNPWRSAEHCERRDDDRSDTGNPNLEYDELALVFFDDYNTRIDHQFSNNLKAYGSWTHNRQSGYGRPTNIQVLELDGTNGNYTPYNQHNVSLGTTWVVNPTTVNDARIGFFRRRSRP